MQHVFVVVYQHFRTAYWSYLSRSSKLYLHHGRSLKSRKLNFLY